MEEMQHLVMVAKALSDPIRVRILELFVQGRDAGCVSIPHPQLPHAICAYVDVLPRLQGVTSSKLSYHLKELRNARLVEEHRAGKQVFYVINQETLRRFLETVQTKYLNPLPSE